MVDTVLKLICASTRAQDANGIRRTTKEAESEVFAQVSSVDRGEFFAAGEQGFRPEYRFTVFAGDYHEESTCEYNGTRYAIYRTYHIPGTDYIELYVQRKVGVNG
jgi:SPP1 family predicted phage head-tail adaptor